MVKVASWNVNSIKVRLPNVLAWIEAAKPDILLLQEVKCLAENFPRLEFESAGYNCAVVGQKSYNGVAVVSRGEIEVIAEVLSGGDEEEQARYLEVETCGLRAASIYLPNGNPVSSEKFGYKLGWMERLQAHAAALRLTERPAVLGGDYNVIPMPEDCHDPKIWEGDALFRPESRNALRRIVNLGYTDALRALHPTLARAFTFWDYQGGAWDQDHGIRIDHLLLSPQAADRLEACEIDRSPRGRDKASDHTPIWCELAD